MTGKEIVERIENILKAASEMAEASKMYPKSLLEGIYPEILEFINRQQEQLEAAANGQETLQKALAEKDREVERLTAEKDRLIKTFGECQAEATKALVEKDKEIKRLKNNVFCSVVIDEGKMRNIVNEKVSEFELDIESIKSEAIKQFAERLKEQYEIWDDDECYFDYVTTGQIDNLVKEMVGDTE